MSLHRYFIYLAYDGTNFHGWQRQPNGITVQQRLEEGMSLMLRYPVKVTGAGRTDQGVHAHAFYAHFEIDRIFSGAEAEKLVFRLNGYLGGEVVVFRIFPVSLLSHARFSALSRTYFYCIARVKNPFRLRYTHFIYGPLDIDLMNAGAGMIRKVRDFTSFSKVDTDTATNICNVQEAFWEMKGDELVFTITADRFLRNMVRAIVGTLIQLGTHKITLEQLQAIIEAKNRSAAGDSAPAQGLTLARIIYPEPL